MRQSAVSLPDALRDALGQVIANERLEWRRERELIEAQAKATVAELRAEIMALRAGVEAEVAARLAILRDGKDGRDGVDGRDGAPGGQGPQGDPGLPGADGAPGRDGKDGADGRDGRDGADGAPGRDGVDGAPGRDGIDGRDGERGPEGPAGKLPAVRAWTDGVHYEGAAVTHAGGVWQAQRDTGREPPHEDWMCIVAAGRDGADGRSMTVRGTWSDGEAYRLLDVVAFNGASFIARRDDPGPCPGDGWQMVAAQGKRGNQGEPGRAGMRGEAGPPAASVAALDVDDEGLLTLTNGDGTRVHLDLYPLLSKIGRG